MAFRHHFRNNWRLKQLIAFSVIYLLSPSLCNRHTILNAENELQMGDGSNFLNGGGGGILGSGSSNFNNFVETINNVNANVNDQCIINYEINEGIIIRTKDSLANGAKYLNESDLGTNIKSKEDCLRICCQTPHCNVITYEEKNSGSCYLFDCGPLEDFRCKFTQQDRYMSALLRRREEPFQLTIGSKNNQHEAELNQLRNVEANNKESKNAEHLSSPVANSALVGSLEGINHHQPQHDHPSQHEGKALAMATATGVGGAGGAQELSAALQQKQQQLNGMQADHGHEGHDHDKNSPSKCSRWQFECKSTKECIAIYNACDGVVQCADGSDEAAELHCPTADQVLRQQQKEGHQHSSVSSSAGTGSSATAGLSGNSGVVGDSSLLPDKGLPSLLSSSRAEDLRLSQLQQQQQQLLQQQQQLLQPPNSRAGSNIVDKGYGNFDTGTGTGGGSSLNAIDQHHNIFNHKDGSILDETYGSQVAAAAAAQQQQQALLQQQHRLQQQQQQSSNPYWKSYDYNNADILTPYGPPVHNSAANYGGVSSNYGYLPPYGPGGQGGGQQLLSNPSLMQQQQQQQAQMQYNNMQLSLENQQQLQQQQQQQLPFLNSNPVFNNGGLHATSPVSGSGSGPAMMPPPQVKDPSATTTTSSTTTTSAPTTKKSTSQQNSQNGQTRKINDEDKLVQSLLQKTALAAVSNPNLQIDKDAMDNVPGGGAIFAFIMGIAMSIMMVIILGCRFRHRKSGARRRGKNRLDPDYLVDGMYL